MRLLAGRTLVYRCAELLLPVVDSVVVAAPLPTGPIDLLLAEAVIADQR